MIDGLPKTGSIAEDLLLPEKVTVPNSSFAGTGFPLSARFRSARRLPRHGISFPSTWEGFDEGAGFPLPP